MASQNILTYLYNNMSLHLDNGFYPFHSCLPTNETSSYQEGFVGNRDSYFCHSCCLSVNLRILLPSEN